MRSGTRVLSSVSTVMVSPISSFSTRSTLFSSTTSPGPGGHDADWSRVSFCTAMLSNLGSAHTCIVAQPAVEDDGSLSAV